MTSEGKLTRLLDNDVLDRLRCMRIAGGRRFTARGRGEHLSRRKGASTDFSDYRDYVPGDDTRFVDWNAFARLRRPYLKLFLEEEELNVVLLVDASASMGFEGKLDLACSLAAAFGLMGLVGGEKVSACAFNSVGTAPARLPPVKGRASLGRTFAFLEGIAPGGDAPVEEAVERFLRTHAGRGMAIVLSDFLTFGDVSRAMNLLFGAGLEPMGVRILSPSECEPELAGDVRLVDSETDLTLDVTAGAEVLSIYREHREATERELSALFRGRGGRFLPARSDAPARDVLLDTMRRRGWIE